MPKQTKLTPADIIDWLHNCIMEAESFNCFHAVSCGYQQTETNLEPWRIDGPPQVVYFIEGKMLVRGENGEVFNVIVTRARKPVDA